MILPPEARLRFVANLPICRVLNGMWQVSGAHGRIDPEAALNAMLAYHDAGFTTWDLADHYGPAEDFIGEFRRRLSNARGADAPSHVQAFTKWVPSPGPMTRRIVESNVDISLRRMGVEQLDLLQFHWWDYGDDRYLDALRFLAELSDEGKLRRVALTNFDSQRLRAIAGHGIRVVSNQVQYSLIDRRPEVEMTQVCEEQRVWLLPYGVLCGGLLNDRYLSQPEPSPRALNTASLRKYKQMVDAWGGWDLFQRLLETLRDIADKHGVSIANVASRYILEQPTVAGVIIGARLGVAEHIAENARIFGFRLDTDDYRAIDAASAGASNLHQVIGDCGDEYRR